MILEIGQSIQEARKKAKLTQKELAEKAGISIATITKMGKEGAVVSSDVLVKICAALDLSLIHI